MLNNYYFDIAAIFIEAIIIFFYYERKNIPSLQNNIFITIVYVLTACSVLEIITALLNFTINTTPVFLHWILECMYYTSTNSFGLLSVLYVCSIVDLFKTQSKWKQIVFRFLIFVPYVIALSVIWLSPLLNKVYPLAFSIVPGTGYIRNNNFWFYLLYGISTYYVVFAFLLVLLNTNKTTVGIRILFLFYVTVIVFAVILQLLFYGLFVQCFGISLATIIFFFYIQKPEDLIDSITGLFNQMAFMLSTENLVDKNAHFVCISILLDDTAFMGNTLGIGQMNKFLKEVGLFLKQRFSYSKSFCLNQECFVVMIKNPDRDEVQEAISVIQNRFRQTWIYEAVELKLYSRLCVINCPEDATSASDVIDIINMLNTDERYKKPVVYANEIDLEDKHRTVYIEHSLRNGLSENRFDVYFQPIYSVAEGKLIGAEALIRLKDEKGRFISPEDFIPIAEKTGTILRIGEFVYESVCRALSLIDIEEYGIKKIDINLSVAQCMQEILAEQILTIQTIYKIPTSIINLEITETAAAHTPEILQRNLQKLSDAGFELSLDDYGSGYSNMNYMLNLPFKMIKIDKYIVWAAYADERAELALDATIKMIKSLGMTVLAEGVEEKDQADWLIKLGCDYLQGYYYSRPVPKKEYLELMLEDKKKHSEQ